LWQDATGHDVYGDIGVFLRDTLNKYLKPKGGRTFYIDPSYIIRSVPPTPNDHIYCARLSHNAVHTAMRGYTGVCVGAIHNIIVILKSKLIAAGKKQLKIKSSTWQTCVQVGARARNSARRRIVLVVPNIWQVLAFAWPSRRTRSCVQVCAMPDNLCGMSQKMKKGTY
jgi:6-phosphofructokinase